MSTQRLTISLPQYLYQQLVQLVPARGMSNFVRTIVEEKLVKYTLDKKEDPITEFFELAKKHPISKTNKQILAAIRKGRT